MGKGMKYLLGKDPQKVAESHRDLILPGGSLLKTYFLLAFVSFEARGKYGA